MNSRTDGAEAGLERVVVLSQGLFLAIVFGFFFSIGNYVLVFQEAQTLFLFSEEYLSRFLSRPGGLLTYTDTFLTQFYAGRVAGPLVLSVVLTLPGVLLYSVTKRHFPSSPVSWLVLLLPSCLLFLMQANHHHMMEHNLGFLLTLLFYLFSVSSVRTYHRILVLVLVPLFYYFAGAYVFVFAGLIVVHTLFLEKGKSRYVYISLVLTFTVISFLLFWKAIFIQSARQTLLSPFPPFENPAYNATLLFLTGYIVFFPFICTVPLQVLRDRFNKRVYSLLSKAIVFAVAIWLVLLEYDPGIARVVELEEMVYAEEWDKAIELQENTPSRFRVGQYLYSISLSETDQLCGRLFSGPQDFGPGSLVLPWSVEHLNNGGLFYYAIGLMNEAHRWAYEDMIVYGYRSRNLKMLAKTSLLNGDHRMARKYINILKGTFYYREWARGFEELADDPDLIRSRPELAAKLDILPKTNFFVEYTDPERNLALLLAGQPDNRKVFEYLIVAALLAKNVEFAVSSLSAMGEAGYSRIPRHLEEAALIQFSLSNVLPDLGGLTISAETRKRFERYSAAYAGASRNPSTLREQMQAEFGDTYWFYFHFS